MRSLGIAIAIAVLASAAVLAVETTETKKRMKIGLVTAGLPWHFEPYQSQMHELSLLLNDVKEEDSVEYDIYWYNYAEPNIPRGKYENFESLRPYIPTSTPPLPGFPLDHLTFLGQTMQNRQISASEFNKLKNIYGLDCLVTLMDITKVVPDAPLELPVVAWTPLHSETVSSATVDYWVLRMYHGVAGLAPSSAKAVHDAVGENIKLVRGPESHLKMDTALKARFGKVQVDFIPHIFDRTAISSSAEVGLALLRDHSVAQADAKLNRAPLINRGQESTLEAGHASSIFGKARKDDFVVLLQGGNYDSEDRKGWDTSLQAFVRFYNSLEDPSRVHLLIHSMESYLIAGDTNLERDAPGAVMPKGLMLHYILHESGLPRSAYTIDIAKHAPQVVAAYKKRADVCLHPSKVEGFGMNVMECQIVGTPVITTNYTAMGDYTKIGRSVPYRQMIRGPQFLYSMAMPDVIGIADALGELYEEHQAMNRGEEAALARREDEIFRFNDWIDTTCSPSVVGDKFKDLLLRANDEFLTRKKGHRSLLSTDVPSYGAYKVVSGYHTPIVDWDVPWTLFAPEGLKIVNPEQVHNLAWRLYLEEAEKIPMVLVLPAKYDDGTDVPFMKSEGVIHEDLPVLVSTMLITGLQGRASRRKSLVPMAMQVGGQPKLLPEGLAIVERKKDNSGASTRVLGSNSDEL